MRKAYAQPMPRHQRMQEIIKVLEDHTTRYYPYHVGMTMYAIARSMGMSPSSNIMSMIKELQREGLVDGYTVIHRQTPDGQDNVDKHYWHLPDYPPVKQSRMDGF